MSTAIIENSRQQKSVASHITPGSPGDLSAAAKANFFSSELINDIKTSNHQLNTAIEYLTWIASGYTERLLTLCRLGSELEKSHQQIDPEAWGRSDQIQLRKKIADLSQQAAVTEQDLLDNFIPELRLQPYQYEVRSSFDPEVSGRQFPFLTSRHLREIVLEKTRSLTEILSSPEAVNSCNLNSLYQDALPFAYASIKEAGRKDLKDPAFLKQFRTYLGAKVSEMSVGIDASYARNDDEHREIASRMDFIRDFESSSSARFPFAGFVYGRSHRRPNDGYPHWAKAITAKIAEDLADQIVESLKSKYAGRFTEQGEKFPDNDKSIYSSYLSAVSSRNLIGFHQIESMLDLLAQSAIISPNQASELRRDLATEAVQYAWSASASSEGLAGDLRNLNREPQHALAATTLFLEANGKNHFVGTLGTNHTTLAFSNLYFDCLFKLKDKGNLEVLNRSLSKEQCQLARLIADPNSHLSQLTNSENLGFFVYNPTIPLFIEKLAGELQEDSARPVLIHWASGGSLSQNNLIQLLKIKELPYLLCNSGIDPGKVPASFQFKQLLRGIALSTEISERFFQAASDKLLQSADKLKELTELRLGQGSKGTYPARKQLISDLLKVLSDKNPGSVFDALLEENRQGLPSAEDSGVLTLESSAAGKMTVQNWDSSKEILLIGEEHTNAQHSRFPIEAFGNLVSAGMTDLALELFSDLNPLIEDYFISRIDRSNLAEELKNKFDPAVLEAEPGKLAALLELIDLCKASNVNIHCVDHSSGLHAWYQTIINSHGADNVEKGQAPELLNKFFYKDRNCEMARNLDLIRKLEPGSGLVLIAGALHIAPRIEGYTIASALTDLGQDSLSIELIGGDNYHSNSSSDPRLSSAIFEAQRTGKAHSLFAGTDRDGLNFVHLPQTTAV